MKIKSWLIKQYEESPNAVWFLIWMSWILTLTSIKTSSLFIVSYLFATPFFWIAYASILAKRMNVSPKRSLFGLIWVFPLLLLTLIMINWEPSSGNDVNTIMTATWFLSSLWISSVYKGYKKVEKNQSEDMSKNGYHSKESSTKSSKWIIWFLARHPIFCYLPIVVTWIYFDAIISLTIVTSVYTIFIAYIRGRSMIWWLIPYLGLLVVSAEASN